VYEALRATGPPQPDDVTPGRSSFRSPHIHYSIKTDEYNAITAAHYAAYRPSLHGPILKKLLGEHGQDGVGLDVGCGTGQSAVALSGHCRYVFGIDPSEAMLALAPEHSAVEFRRQTKAALADQIPGLRFDLVAFAGSLFYQNKAEIVICFPDLLSPKAKVVIYDFDVDFSPVFSLLGFTPPTSDYDHQCGFDAYLSNGLTLTKEWAGALTFTVSAVELAHLLCSVMPWREALSQGRTFGEFVGRLDGLYPEKVKLRAECFGKCYNYRSTPEAQTQTSPPPHQRSKSKASRCSSCIPPETGRSSPVGSPSWPPALPGW